MLKRKEFVVALLLTMLVFGTPALLDVSILSATRYALWTLVWSVLGYAVVSRRVAGKLERWVLGSVVGVAAQLGNWVVWQTIGLPRFTVLGALVALVCAILRLRRTSRTRREAGPAESADAVTATPFSSLNLLVGATAWMAVAFIGFARHQSRPPGPSTMYQDLYWHLGIAAELKRSALPTIPQAEVLGRLNYHWLSDAYMASGSLGSFTSTADVVLRLWYLPVVALTFGLCLVVGKRLSGGWVAGNVAILLTVIPASVLPFAWMGGVGPSSPFLWLSPSQIFGLVFTLAATWLFIPVLRSGRLGAGEAALLVVTVFLCAGAKSSILPVFLGGAFCVALLFIRRSPIRRGALMVGGLCLVGIAMAVPLFAGGSAGSKIRLLSSFRRLSAYRQYVGLDVPLDHGPFVMPYLATGGVLVLVAALCIALLVQYAYVASSLSLGRTWVEDPLPVFLLGGFAASIAAFLLIDHTGFSQAYFPLGALPLIALLAGWGVAAAWERGGSRHRWGRVLAGAAAGAVVIALMRLVSGSEVPAKNSLPAAVFVIACLALAAVVAAMVLRRRTPVLAVGALLGAALVQPAITTVTASVAAASSSLTDDKPWTVTAQETAAAEWLRVHSNEHDVVATNVHCRTVTAIAKCDSRAYWVSALTERRVFIESWGYTDQAQRDAGKGGVAATNQPFADHELYMTNENLFHAPSAQAVAQLKSHGVRWLFGDSRASKVSSDLDTFAELAHRQGTVSIYRLR